MLMLGGSAPSCNKNIVCRVEPKLQITRERANRQSEKKRKDGEGGREGGREGGKWKRKTGGRLLLPQERFHVKTHTHGRLSCPIRQITVEKRRGGGVRWMECVRVCVCVCVCVCVAGRPTHLIYRLRQDLSVRYTLTHTHIHTLARRSLKYLLASCGEISRDYPQ